MSNVVIRAQSLSKRYRIRHRKGTQHYNTLRDALADKMLAPWRRLKPHRANEKGTACASAACGDQSTREDFWALRDVCFEVEQGGVVGIVGRNGAGKSTLLKILSRITEPTAGNVRIKGRVASLLEVGTGFHPELTGRENIFLNGAILGMSRAEIRQRFDEIVEFADVETFLDTPVKRYSSGMYVRLAFAVAAHLEPEILLVDEVLAVGDAAFQKKCLGKMGEVAKAGRTVLFVSHNMAAVQNLCESAFFLDKGAVAGQGKVDSVIEQYLRTDRELDGIRLAFRKDRRGSGRLRFLDFSGESNAISCGSNASFMIEYEGTPPLRNVHVSMGFYNPLGEGVLYLANDMAGFWFSNVPDRGFFKCNFGRMPLLPGTYVVNLYSTVNGILADWVTDAAVIEVADGDFFGSGKLPPKGYGVVMVDHEWSIVQP